MPAETKAGQHPKTVIVTGSARGLGLAMADRFAAREWNVVMLDRDPAINTVSMPSIEASERILRLVVDLTEEEELGKAIDTIYDTFGEVDVLINNAGLAPVVPFFETSLAYLREILRVNVEAVFSITQMVTQRMVDAGVRGNIIIVGTANGVVGVNQTAAYTASKGAVMAMVRELAVELAPAGIRCNVLAPGTVITPRVQAMLDDEGISRRLAQIPAGRFAKEEDIASAAEFLASDASAMINGQTIVVDGGFSVKGA